LFNERSYFSRNPALINDAKLKYGFKCQVCEFSFEEKYAELGVGYIECHHTNPLSERSDLDELKTKISDIAVVCANCHRMLHRRSPALTIEQLKEIMAKNI
jgi:5-methylcytosine-specific restriction protein A